MAEDIEEFDEDTLDLDLGEETAPAMPEPPRRGGRPPAKSPNSQLVPTPAAEAKMKKAAEEAAEQEQPRVIAVPRVVPMSTMVNEIYDTQQRHEQLLLAILEALEAMKNKK